ncbi:hypothetical protein M885DRAFT_470685 [Pelagophyceae sp. CCMP2097]|nr:hypothetical protein M885DRAFT_470685 [Pelagophyceae sp. CCMP2097]
MKIYMIKGVEGAPGYVKQSMKLPKSWDGKTLHDVLGLFVETYNKKAEAPLDASQWHLERPKGSTLFPDDQVGAALQEYADVFVEPGAVKYKGPPAGTAAALELVEAAAREIAEKEAAEAEINAADDDGKKAQWMVKIKCVALDRGGMDVKSLWKVGDVAKVKIEPHATVGMLQNRIGLIVGAHPKHQTLRHPKDLSVALGPLDKLKEVMTEKTQLELTIIVPCVLKVITEVDADEGCVGAEAAELPPAASDADCADAEAQQRLKAEAEDKVYEDAAAAVDLLSQALALGGASAQLVCKRAEALLKAKRPLACEADATAALARNPDSAKAYKLRAKARRMLGKYDDALADFGQAQRIDFDDSIAEEQAFVSSHVKKLRLYAIAIADHAAAAEKAAAKEAAQAAKP